MSEEQDTMEAPRRPAQETWREVMDLKIRLVEMQGDIRKIASLADDHVKLELRVRALELTQATTTTKGNTALFIWTTVVPSLLTLAAVLYNAFIKH